MRFETQTNLYDNQPLITKLTSHDTRFDVVQGEINALISESEMTELIDGGSTMYSAMNDIKIDVSGLHADLSEMNTTIDGQSGQITQLNSKQAEYEASLESLSATLSDTNADLYGDDGTTGVINRVTAIEATTSGLSSSVSSISTNLQTNYYTKNAVDSIASGIGTDAANALSSAVSSLQGEIDEKIETWCGDAVPTTSNYPASDWNTTALKEQHIGDLYYDTKGGYSYQYTKTGNTYSWNAKTTSGINDAILLAGNKKRVFVAQPVPPYEIGDLWVQGANGDIMRCGTARASGSYNSSDWVKASKYTDDSALNTFKNGQYAQDITEIGAQLDEKVEVHYGTVVPTLSNAPASSWSAEEKVNHLDDLYYNTASGYCYRFIRSGSSFAWTRIKDSDITSAASVATSAQSLASGKATIFTGQPITPYNVGDLWVQGAGGEILRCKTAKASGAYDSSHWEKASKYTDDTKADSALSEISTVQTQVQATSTRVEQLDSSITLVAEKVENINIGGANLIRDSALTDTLGEISYDDSKSELDFVTYSSKKCLKISNALDAQVLSFPLTASVVQYDDQQDKYILCRANDIFTFSAYVNTGSYSPTSSESYVQFRPSEASSFDVIARSDNILSNVETDPYDVQSLSGSGWQYIWITVKCRDNYIAMKPYIVAANFSGSMYFHHCKVEKGEYATSWNAAVEDGLNYTDDQIVAAKAAIKVTTDAIELEVSGKVDGNYVSSAITQSADAIRLKADKIAWTSTNSSMTEEGTLSCQNANVSGFINATTGFIGNWIIHQDKIYGGTAETGVAVVQAPNATNVWVFAAGGDTHTTYGGCPFRVHKNGNLYAIGGNIAGFTMSDTGFAYAPNSGERLYMNHTQGFKTFNTSSKQSVEVYNGAVRFLHTTADGSKTYLGGYFSQNRDDISEIATSFYYVASTSLNAKGTEKLRIHAGGITVNGTIDRTSDARLKKDISNLDNDYLSLIDEIEPKQFRYIESDNRVNLGFIAQDVKEILDKNGINDDSIVSGTGEGSYYYTLDYTQFIPILVKKCQKQDEEIKRMKEEIQELKNAVSALSNQK